MSYYANFNAVSMADMSEEPGWIEITEQQYRSGADALLEGREVVVEGGFYIRDKAPSELHVWDGAEWVLPPQPEPEPEPEPPLPPLQKWRFEAMVDLNGMREQIDQAIEAMPEPQRTIAYSKRNYVPEFYRDDPLFDALGDALGMEPGQIDILWQQALDL